MADIRELIILDPSALDARPETPWMSRLADLRMMARRAVVRSAANPLFTYLYTEFYRFHLWVAVQLGKRFAGTRAVYLSSGLATGDVVIGVSDVDLAIYGDWPERRQFRLMKVFGLLTVLSPLFDRASIGSIGTPSDLQALCATDMMMALTHAKGARQWKLLHGEPILSQLPRITPERFSGCVYMDHRRWWCALAGVAFGKTVVARDAIFRNSICFKAVAGSLRAERMLADNDMDISRRAVLVEQEFARSGDPLLRVLLDSAKSRYLEIEADPREPTLRWFLDRAERFHRQLRGRPAFTAVKPVRVVGDASEASVQPQSIAHAQHLAELAKREWSGLHAIFLMPSISMFSPDSSSLLFDVDPSDLPSLDAIQHLCAEHLKASAGLPQRMAIYLLLPNAAYQLDPKSSLEFFHYTYLPEANPDIFIGLSNKDFVLYGQPRPPTSKLGWSPFAQELALEELHARRGAYRRFGLNSRPKRTENLRNFWRLLQLVVIERSQSADEVTLPVTVPAIRRELVRLYPETEDDLQALEKLFSASLRGNQEPAADAEEIVQRVFTLLSRAD